MLKPGFFIVGAPRCGTTALSRYLSRHPHMCFSRPKEPHFFSRASLNLSDLDLRREYIDRFFPHYDMRTHKVLGEGSVSYIYSADAISKILTVNPQAKFLAMVRNPIDMIYSYHSRLVFTMDENVKKFPEAWGLQQERSTGRHIPRKCRDPRLLRYAEIGMLGRQVDLLFKLVPRDRCKVIVFDDFAENPRQIYERVLAFIGLEYDGQKHFPRKRANRYYHSSLIQHALVRSPEPMVGLLRFAQRAMGAKELQKRLRRMLRELNTAQVSRPELDNEMRETLSRTFAPDVHRLSELLNRNLSHWLA